MLITSAASGRTLVTKPLDQKQWHASLVKLWCRKSQAMALISIV